MELSEKADIQNHLPGQVKRQAAGLTWQQKNQ